MKERPILFSAPMVRALLAGTKTQTRRVVKNRRDPNIGCDLSPGEIAVDPMAAYMCPYCQPGDRLWVREAWKAHTTFDDLPPRDLPRSKIWYLADDGYKAQSRTRASMHMPRWASRITLEITGVRVERLQDISEADAIAEGMDRFPGCRQDDDAAAFNRIGPVMDDSFPIARYAALWESINGPGSWDANPWVWVVEFRRLP